MTDSIYISPIGKLLIESDGEYITAVSLMTEECKFHSFRSNQTESIKERQHDEINCISKGQKVKPQCIIMTEKWLDGYFNGENPDPFSLPLKLEGSPYRKKVWEILKKIPYGKTITYGEIAKMLTEDGLKGRMSSQAVGGAVGHNPISIIIPCHRVIGKGNNLTGYAGGLDSKIFLLKTEGHDVSKFKRPEDK